jgi:hypothetical protein
MLTVVCTFKPLANCSSLLSTERPILSRLSVCEIGSVLASGYFHGTSPFCGIAASRKVVVMGLKSVGIAGNHPFTTEDGRCSNVFGRRNDRTRDRTLLDSSYLKPIHADRIDRDASGVQSEA